MSTRNTYRARPTGFPESATDLVLNELCRRGVDARAPSALDRVLRQAELIAQQFATKLAPIAPAVGCAGGAKLTEDRLCTLRDRSKYPITECRQAVPWAD